MEVHKAPGTIRIFIFGESAALGDPAPNYGAGRYLQALLENRFPAKKFEVINTGITAINSHAILPIARECARYDGDFWLVYMGNNEMVGPFGAATVFGSQAPPLAMVRLNLALQNTRLGQLFTSLARKFARRSKDSQAWHGMEMFLENRIPPNDPRRTAVYHSFEQNLKDILSAGSKAGAKVIVNTVAVNLKDSPPFASLDVTNLAPAQRDSFTAALAAATNALAQNRFAEATQDYQNAERLSPASADVQYGLGQCALALTNLTEARKHFQLACDDDTLPFRTDDTLNSVLTKAVDRFHSANVTLCDAAGLLASNTPSQIPGAESFYEHVHFNFDGNYRLARLWADSIRNAFSPGQRAGEKPQWASQEQCERLVGLTDWNRVAVYEEVQRRLGQPPFTSQANQSQRLASLRASIDALHHQLASAPTNEPRQVYLEALQRAPEDYRLHENFAVFLESIHALPEATTERRKIRELTPDYYFSEYSLGMVLKEQGQLAEAADCFKKAIGLNPYQGELYLQLGITLARQSQWQPAFDAFQKARQLSPNEPRALLYSAEVLGKLGRQPEAVDLLEMAVRLHPDYWEAHYRLGEDLARREDITGAANQFSEVLRLNPTYLKARLNLGIALLKLGRLDQAETEFDEALRLDPQNQTAAQLKRQVQQQRLHAP